MKTLFQELKFNRSDENGNTYAIRSFWKTLITVYEMANNKYVVETLKNNSKSNHLNCTRDFVEDILANEKRLAKIELNEEFVLDEYQLEFSVEVDLNNDTDYDSYGSLEIEQCYDIKIFPCLNNLYRIEILDFAASDHDYHISTYHRRSRHWVKEVISKSMIDCNNRTRGLDIEKWEDEYDPSHDALDQMSRDGWNEGYPDGYRSDDDGDSMYP